MVPKLVTLRPIYTTTFGAARKRIVLSLIYVGRLPRLHIFLLLRLF